MAVDRRGKAAGVLLVDALLQSQRGVDADLPLGKAELCMVMRK